MHPPPDGCLGSRRVEEAQGQQRPKVPQLQAMFRRTGPRERRLRGPPSGRHAPEGLNEQLERYLEGFRTGTDSKESRDRGPTWCRS